MKHCCWPILLIFLLVRIWGSDCENQELVDMDSVDTGEYIGIVWEGRTYVPWGPVSNSDRGRKIGYVDGDEKDQVYAFRGWPEEEWIISFYNSGLMDCSMLMREEHVMDIPPGLSSEYPWNDE